MALDPLLGWMLASVIRLSTMQSASTMQTPVGATTTPHQQCPVTQAPTIIDKLIVASFCSKILLFSIDHSIGDAHFLLQNYAFFYCCNNKRCALFAAKFRSFLLIMQKAMRTFCCKITPFSIFHSISYFESNFLEFGFSDGIFE
jgi:hypothetical protein